MSYTRPWSSNTPSKNRPANQTATAIRELRLDVEERMNTVLTGLGSWTSDPTVAASASKYMLLHWSAFKPTLMYGSNAGASASNFDSAGLSTQFGVRILGSGSLVINAPIILPRPCTLVDVSIFGHTAANTSIAATVYEVDVRTTSPTRTSLATRTVAASTGQAKFSVSSGANINKSLIDDRLHYWIEIVLTNTNAGSAAFGFQGALIQYTRSPLVYV